MRGRNGRISTCFHLANSVDRTFINYIVNQTASRDFAAELFVSDGTGAGNRDVALPVEQNITKAIAIGL